MKHYLLGIDIGTSGCKVSVFDRDGQVIASASQTYPVYYPHPGWAEQNPQEWWLGVCRALHQLWGSEKVRPRDISGIGIAGMSWSAVALDRDGDCLLNTPIWMDTRAQEICSDWNQKIGGGRIFNLAGNSLQPSYTTAKVRWYQENRPECYKKIDKILQSNSYIAYRLTGALTQDMSQGYGWHCFCMRTGQWDLEMAGEMGVPSSFLPPIVRCDQIIGTVTKQASIESGLQEGTPVAAGGLDAACGTLGAGAVHPGDTQEQGGQAGGMSICLTEYHADPRLILSFHVVPGVWLLQGGTTGGGGVMRWFEQEFAGEERRLKETVGKSSLDQINEMAGRIPPGSDGVVFLPYMNGERSPIWDPKAKGLFYGLDFAKTRGHMARACMEGVAYALRHNLDTAREAGAEVKKLRAMGGSANSLLWTQIKADITQKPILVPSSDTATTLGAAMLAGVGIGFYRDYEEAVRMTVREVRRHTPNMENQAVYEQGYQVYRELYETLKDLMKRGQKG